MSDLVCDASVLFKLLVPEEGTETARALAANYGLVTLDFAFAELGNAIWARLQKREFDSETGQALVARLLTSTIETRPVRPLIPRALTLADEIAHPIYDCTYLALAETLAIPLVTADQRFLNALRRVKLHHLTEVKPLAAFA